MKSFILKALYAVHIYDGEGQLDLEDMAFMLLVGKIMMSPGIDWTAVCTLVPIIAAQMHVRSSDSKKP